MLKALSALILAVIISSSFLIGGAASARASEKAGHSQPLAITYQAANQCLGQNFLWNLVAANQASVTNNAAVACRVLFLIYDTHGNADLKQGPQDLIRWAEALVEPGKTVFLTVPAYDAACFVQIDVVVGWFGNPISHLTYQNQYGTEMLAKYAVAGQGPALTRGSKNCDQKSPTPTPVPPTPVPTVQTPVLPSPTAVPTVIVPLATATPTKTQPATTKTVVPPTATIVAPTMTPPPPTQAKAAPTETPVALKTPVAPNSGNGIVGNDAFTWGLALLAIASLAGAFVSVTASFRR